MKLVRASTIGASLNTFCRGVFRDLQDRGFEVIAISSPDNRLAELSSREGVRSIGIPMERKVSYFRDFVSLVRLIRCFYSEKPTIVHSITPKAGLLCMIAAWSTKVPVRIHTFTGLVWPTATGFSRKILMLTDKVTCSCATHIIPEGQGVFEDLQNHGITKKPMKVLGFGNVRGVDLAFYSLRPEIKSKASLLTKEKTFTFLFVGRLVKDKGITELVSAFGRLVDSYSCPKCRLILVGMLEQNLDPLSNTIMRKINTNPHIEFVGPQFGDDLVAWYAASDCFVFPSYREGFPNTVLEAGALGLSSIVTDINGSREIITDADYQPKRLEAGETMSIRKNGVVIPSKNEEALFDAMRWMMENPDARQKMADCARQMVEERFEQGFVRQCLYDFYDEVLSTTKK